MNSWKMALASALLLFASLEAKWHEKKIVYDNFKDEGASYSEKWDVPFYGIAGETYFQDGGSLVISFPNGKLKVSSPQFQWASDNLFFDHIKYLATSKKAFRIPKKGSIEFSADIKAKPFNTVDDLKMIARRASDGRVVKYLINKGRQGSATLHMLNYHETGVLFDWFVYGDQAFALYERLFDAPLYPANIETAFTQIVKTFKLDSHGTHKFAIRYTRNVEGNKDFAEYLIDDKVVVTIKNIGIPLDKQKHWSHSHIVDPSQGPGERVKDLMNTMIIGHGLFTLLDVFPYQQQDLEGTSVTIPLRGPPPEEDAKHPRVSSRIWGQGVEAKFDNFKVVIRTKR